MKVWSIKMASWPKDTTTLRMSETKREAEERLEAFERIMECKAKIVRVEIRVINEED